jgi:hypothetical protein
MLEQVPWRHVVFELESPKLSSCPNTPRDVRARLH